MKTAFVYRIQGEIMASEKSEQGAIPAALAPADSSDMEKGKKEKPVQHWKQGEEHIIPKNRMSLVFSGLMCCVFLAALDQVCTIIVLLAWRCLGTGQTLTSYFRPSLLPLCQPL